MGRPYITHVKAAAYEHSSHSHRLPKQVGAMATYHAGCIFPSPRPERKPTRTPATQRALHTQKWPLRWNREPSRPTCVTSQGWWPASRDSTSGSTAVDSL